MNDMFSVKDKVFVITGGAGILGKAWVRHFVKEGAKISLLDRDQAVGEAFAKEIADEGGDIIFSATDVLDKASVEASCEATLNKFGRVDVLINGAGGNMAGATVPPESTIFDIDLNAFKKVVDLNLFGTVIPTLVFAKPMTEQKKGSIINVASESALRPLTRVAGYGVAKSAVVSFTQYMCGELAKKFSSDLRVNAIVPGFFLTNQNRALLTNPDGSLTQRSKDILAHTPQGIFGEPDDLLGALQYLASDASRFVSGTLTIIDGGFNAFSI